MKCLRGHWVPYKDLLGALNGQIVFVEALLRSLLPRPHLFLGRPSMDAVGSVILIPENKSSDSSYAAGFEVTLDFGAWISFEGSES